MKLVNASVCKYKSIEDSGTVKIEPDVTVLVGKNESGKTAFLEALHKTNNLNKTKFDALYDYPRKDYSTYRKQHESGKFEKVVQLNYGLDEDEIEKINTELFNGTQVIEPEFMVTREHHYGNGSFAVIKVDEKKALTALQETLEDIKLVKDIFAKSNSIFEVIAKIEEGSHISHQSLAGFYKDWHERCSKAKEAKWASAVEHYIWTTYLPFPTFVYFDDYRILAGKINLQGLQERITQKNLTESDETALGLFDLAGISVDELLSDEGYESSRAKLEAISLTVSEQVFEFWKQNNDLSVEFDIKTDPVEQAPFNTGKNLYIRVKNKRHGVTVPFDQRSKGFIWFFSFLVWFSSIERRLNTQRDLVLLLDEPGLSLHALAQNDFLSFIDHLAKSQQVIYTTHSPFMVENDSLQRVRVVEDKSKIGTTVSGELGSSSDESLFPLQAALGYSIAQNLFIAKKNILIEGPADLILLTHMSSVLESLGKNGLKTGTLVPVGGLDKLATFIALLGATKLEVVVLHDRASKPHQGLEQMIQQKLIEKKKVLDYSIFRKPENVETDIEDLFGEKLYLEAFNECYGSELGKKLISASELKKHPRIIERINIWLKEKSIEVKHGGGFNHYRVAQSLLPKLSSQSLKSADLEPFEKLFEKLNSLFA